ncbi:MAG TPA: hypothetical protein VKW08_07355 [Xanthobacteraceae bacterium]|nr:hypothetical protein [Xanthobacteraceae bacterium]
MLFALAVFVAATAANTASARPCCTCAYGCALPAPPPIQIWGLTPSYGVIQGPVYTGPGYYTGPTYQTEVSTAEYPYSGSSDFFDAGPNVDPFRNDLYHPYWPMLLGLSPRRYHSHDAGMIYRRGAGARALSPSAVAHVPGHGEEGAER